MRKTFSDNVTIFFSYSTNLLAFTSLLNRGFNSLADQTNSYSRLYTIGVDNSFGEMTGKCM